jgi:predicted transcriptional regulator
MNQTEIAWMEDQIIDLTAQIVSAHVAANNVSPNQLPALIRAIHQTLTTVGQAPAEPIKAEPAVSVRKSVFPDHIVCLDCGGSFKMLKKHIATDHELNPAQYRLKWQLPHDYPMVSAEYAATRSQLAKDSGLGRKAKAPPPQKMRGRPKKG